MSAVIRRYFVGRDRAVWRGGVTHNGQKVVSTFLNKLEKVANAKAVKFEGRTTPRKSFPPVLAKFVLSMRTRATA